MSRIQRQLGGMLAAMVICGAGVALAQVDGTLTTTDGRKVQGQIKWRDASKVYEVLQASGATVNYKPDQVARVQAKMPADLEAAARSVAAGGANAEKAIPALKKIVETYKMLAHDVTATRWLAEAYLKTGDARAAAAACDTVMQYNPNAALDPDFARVYKDVLLATEQYDVLNTMLTRIVQMGTRDTAATAQMIRGDIAMKQGKYKDALLDGYLRTVVLFADMRAVQPEAIYKASQCFEKLGQAVYAEKMRKKLLEEFPQSSYAQEIKSGK
jgi:predicted negative regulator of RcsB-dependent stress response